MRPNFALNLSHEGIVLLHRSPRGTWTEVGEVALDDPALRENLSFLRSTAVGLEGKGFGAKLILPDSQVLHLEVNAPGPDDAARNAQILAALDGKTPYALDDLVIDWRPLGPSDSAMLQVAVVAKETLDEAEEFAVEHRFNPITFVGQASQDGSEWQPYFGRSDYSFAFLDGDVSENDLRELPPPVPVPTTSENLFFGEDPEAETATQAPTEDIGTDNSLEVTEGDVAPTDDSENTGESFFDSDQDAPSDVNIFATDGGTTAETETEAATEPKADTKPAAAFSSRRQNAPLSASPAASSLDRVAPRITIGTQNADYTDEPADELAGDSVDEPAYMPDDGTPTSIIIAEDQLRASFLDAPDEPRQNLAKSLFSKATPFAMMASGRVLTAARKGADRSKILAQKAASRLARTKPAASENNIPESAVLHTAASQAASPQAGDLALNEAEIPADPTLTTAPPASKDQRRRKAILIASTGLVLLALLGTAYLYFSASDPISNAGGTDATNTALLTTSSERGVHADNRARARPSDFAETLASLSPSTDGSIPDIPLIPTRPERRSVFEGRVDPDSDLPDTATPVTALSEQELADIRAAGLPSPTSEEIAEGSQGTASPRLSPAEIAAAYEATGILQGLLPPPRPNADQFRDDIFVAALDRALEANDAIVLPDFNTGVQDDPPARRLSPLAPNLVFDLDENGLVKPSKEGTLNPDGILVHLGKPAITPPTKPQIALLVPPNPLLNRKPKARPAGLRTGEAAIFVQGRLTLAKLRARKPKPRPISEQAELTSGDASPTELAVLTSFQPAKRPSDFDKTVEKARVRLASTAPGTATGKVVPTGPVLPTRASVAKTATIKNAINLARINLIGVYGTASKRNALLRLPSGRFVKVKIGDRIDGGRVAAIGVASISYVKSGRNRVLKIPQ